MTNIAAEDPAVYFPCRMQRMYDPIIDGPEFAYHQKVSRKLGAGFYFAKPYHSWERGLNEPTNWLVRQYFLKKTNFSDISLDEVKRVELLLNNRPRKVPEISKKSIAKYLNEAGFAQVFKDVDIPATESFVKEIDGV